MLLESGYVFCLFDGLNRFYLASEREAIGLALTAPACVFDQPYVTPPHAALLKEYDNAIDGYHKLEELYEKAISDFETMNGRYLQTVADYQRLEGAHLQTVADYQRLEGAHLQTVADYERLSELLEQQAKELGGLESASSAMKFELQLLQDQRDVLRVGVATMGGEFDSLRAERDMWRGEAELMRTTLSRRVTRPLRAVRRHEELFANSLTRWAIELRRASSSHSLSRSSANAAGSTGESTCSTTAATSSKIGRRLVIVGRPRGSTERRAPLADSGVAS